MKQIVFIFMAAVKGNPLFFNNSFFLLLHVHSSDIRTSYLKRIKESLLNTTKCTKILHLFVI